MSKKRRAWNAENREGGVQDTGASYHHMGEREVPKHVGNGAYVGEQVQEASPQQRWESQGNAPSKSGEEYLPMAPT